MHQSIDTVHKITQQCNDIVGCTLAFSVWNGDSLPHRRRINTEETTKVVAAVWETEFVQFLATLDI